MNFCVSNQALHLTHAQFSSLFLLCDNFWFSETQIAKCQKTTTQQFWKHSHPREGFMLDAHYPAQEGCLQLPSAWSGPSGSELRSMLLNSQWEELRFTVSTLRYLVIPSGHGECPCSRKTSTSGSISVQETWPILAMDYMYLWHPLHLLETEIAWVC